MEYRHEVCVRRLQKENQVTVVFFAMCLSMWRYQSLYERMMQNRSFSCIYSISSLHIVYR